LIDVNNSDERRMLTAEQCRGARAMLGWSQDDLAKAAFVGRQTVADFERGARMPIANNLASMRQAFERAGIEFLFRDDGAETAIFLRHKPNFSDQWSDNVQFREVGQENSGQGSEINSSQCKMARVALGWGTRDLARAAGVSTDTVARMERGERLKPSTVKAFRSAFEAAGIEFIPENGGGPGVRAPKRKD
jgi:transcriptional regulator with XRE-family HTH domain